MKSRFPPDSGGKCDIEAQALPKGCFCGSARRSRSRSRSASASPESSSARSSTRVPKPFSAIVTSTPSTALTSSASSGSDFISVRDASIMRPASTRNRPILPPNWAERDLSGGRDRRPSDIDPLQVWSMSDGRDFKRSGAAWELAGRQHGVVARRQLLALGFNAREIEHRVARRRLHPIMRGVYAVGWPKLSRERRWMAATLACGEGALLSHRSAAALWEIGTERHGVVDISVMRRAELKRRGLHVRGRSSLNAERVTSWNGIPVTPVQTLIDISTELSPARVERAVNEADKRDLIDPETLRAELDRYAGEPGVKAL